MVIIEYDDGYSAYDDYIYILYCEYDGYDSFYMIMMILSLMNYCSCLRFVFFFIRGFKSPVLSTKLQVVG